MYSNIRIIAPSILPHHLFAMLATDRMMKRSKVKILRFPSKIEEQSVSGLKKGNEVSVLHLRHPSSFLLYLFFVS